MSSGYSYRHPLVVRLRDLDGLGHVNNAAVVTYLEDARTAYLLGRRGKTRISEFDFILARTEIDYRSPAYLHEELEVLVRPKRIGRKSFDLEYVVRATETGRVIAEAITVLVTYDFNNNASCPIPEDLRSLLTWDLQLDSEP
jgi:acyl-CoA thioester hydrolase